MTDQLDAIQAVLIDVDRILCERLAEIGAADLAHILVAVASDGAALVRGNVDPEGLKALAQDLSGAADREIQRRPDNGPLD